MKTQKSIDLSRLKTNKQGEILWAESAGKTVPFQFGEHSGELTIIDYNARKHIVEVQFGELKAWLGVTKIYYCNLEKLFKTTTKQFLYEPGEVVNGLQITAQIWLDKERGYAYKCTVCGHEGTVLQTKLKQLNTGCARWKQHGKGTQDNPENGGENVV